MNWLCKRCRTATAVGEYYCSKCLDNAQADSGTPPITALYHRYLQNQTNRLEEAIDILKAVQAWGMSTTGRCTCAIPGLPCHGCIDQRITAFLA